MMNAAAADKRLVIPVTSEGINVVKNNTPLYTLGEEIANAITHGVGAGLSVAALVLLIVRAATSAPEGMVGGHVVGYATFGVSMLILYLISTLYHALPPSRGKRVFALLDHSAIFIFIAGTYTAYCLGPIYGRTGWWTFGTLWALAIIGVVAYCVYERRARAFTLVLYLVMGWFGMLVWRDLYAALPQISWNLVLLGGFVYTLGVAFFMMKKVRWMHTVWHLFVLGGSVLHFFSIYWAIG
jgi:hemolysin III